MKRRNTKNEANILARQLLALDLRKRGLSYRAIGEKLDISHEQARQDIEAELSRLAVERDGKVELHRQLELERLDMIMDKLDHWVAAGNPQAVTAYLKAMERRAKMLGLDAPQKHDVTWRDIAQESGLSEADIASEFEALVDSAVNKLTEQGES